MANYYNLDGIKTELRKDIIQTRATLEAWEKVSFPTKKDGTPFKTMSKNISGAKYYCESWRMQACEYSLSVCNSSKHGYVTDSIDAHCLVKYLTDEAMKAKTENYQPKVSYLEQVYTYDLDDIKAAIRNRIAYLSKRIANLEEQLENADSVFHNFRNAYAAAIDSLVAESGKEQDSTLYYMVLNTVRERFPYC